MKRTAYFLTIMMFSVALAGVISTSAHASQPRLLSVEGDWSAYVFTEGGNKVCYIASKPTKSEGKYSSRGEIFALITDRPNEGSRNVFSYITGYDYKAGSDASVDIDGQSFVLFTQDDTAWTPDGDMDNRLAAAIKTGSKMVVRGVSSRGTKTKDTFSLRGSGAAQDRVKKECR